MSSKHLRRLLEEQEKEKQIEDEESEEESRPVKAVANRFAFIESDEDDNAGQDEEEVTDVSAFKTIPVKKSTGEKMKSKKKKKKQDKEKQEEILDDDQLLEKLALENLSIEQDVGTEVIGVDAIFKVDPRLFDPAAELKKVLGKTFKESGSQPNNSRNQWKGAGRLVKQKMNWPPLKNHGLSMLPVTPPQNNVSDIKWFKFEHGPLYEKLEKMCWIGEQSLDMGMADEILREHYFHLNSLLMFANMLRMQEDVTQAGDLIERGIFHCEQSFHPLFQVTSWNHRIDYTDYENRAFYLLLHRFMLNCAHKRCFETALNVGKLIFGLDPQRDPLAMILVLDSIAIKAKQYKWLQSMYHACADWKNLSTLPNVKYSLALSYFLQSNTEIADELLTDAICAFPGVITQVLDELQIQADPAVEANSFLSVFAYSKEPDGLKLIIKIYVKQIAEMFKDPQCLAWLERVTRQVVEDKSKVSLMDSEREKRQRLFVGCPANVNRLAILLGYESSSSGVTDPNPPPNGRQRYDRTAALTSVADQGFLSGFIHSLIPDFNPEDNLGNVIGRLVDRVVHSMQPAVPQDAPNQDENTGQN